jgi:hypothetical protein
MWQNESNIQFRGPADWYQPKKKKKIEIRQNFKKCISKIYNQ